MSKCLNCGKEVEQKEGKRERKFCDNKDKCKMAYHNKHKKQPKYVLFKTFKDLLDKYEELKSVKVPGIDTEPTQNASKTKSTSSANKKLIFPKKGLKKGKNEVLDTNIEFKEAKPESYDGEKANYTFQDEFGQMESNPKENTLSKGALEIRKKKLGF